MDTFSVRVQVRDQHGAETDWSSPHDIAIGCPFALRVAEGVPFYIPTACALSPLGDYLYVCQAGGGVLRLRTRDGRIDTLYQSLSISLAMAVHPGGSRLYCITFDGIEVVNLPQGTLDTVVDVWPWTGMTAKVLPNGQYLCVVYDSQGPDSSAVCVVRTQDNSLVKAVPVGPAPYGLATLPGSDYVYVSSAHDSSVLAIRVDDPAVTATIPVGPRPRGIVASPDGSRVYVACEGDTVWVIDPTVNQVIDRLPVSSYGYDLDITSDGRYLFGADYSGGIVWVVHLASRKVASGVQAPAPRQVAVSSAGHRVYVRSWTDFGIRVIEY
jgi:YVTN family beta-propeller protein